jgi:hypothetical protein
MPILHPLHWIAKSIINTMKYHVKMHDSFTLAWIVDKSKILITPLLNELAWRVAPKPRSSNYNEPNFYPFGYYTFIEKYANKWRDIDLQRYHVYIIDDENLNMTRKLKDVRFGFQDWEYHKLEDYKTILMEFDLIDLPQVNS